MTGMNANGYDMMNDVFSCFCTIRNIVGPYCIQQNKLQILLPQTFLKYSNPFLYLIIDLKNMKCHGAFFKSGPGFWFCQEVAEKSKTVNFTVIVRHKIYNILR